MAELLGATKGRLDGYNAEYTNALAAYKSAIQSGTNSATAEAAVRDVLRRWRGFTQEVGVASDLLQENSENIDDLTRMTAEIEEQKQILQRLRTEARTRTDQADTLNPKERPSPYTNILGLGRIFRPPTRTALIAASILFGILALGLIGILVFRAVRNGGPATTTTSTSVSPIGGIPKVFGSV